jgi:hypothetical protein
MKSAEREFHPSELREATTKINEILKSVRSKGPRGKKLSLLHGPGGMMLVWCEHGNSIRKKGSVTFRSAPERVKEALGLAKPARKAP